MDKEFNPVVLQQKEELHQALQEGRIKSSKFNALNIDEKEFISLVVFSGYTPIQAIRTTQPQIKNPGPAAKRMAARPEVAAVLEELTYAKKAYWMAQLESERERSLQKMVHIRNTTDDESLAAAVSDKIWGRANEELIEKKPKDDGPSGFTFVINTAPPPAYLGGKDFDPNSIIEMEEDTNESNDVFKLIYGERSKQNYNK